MRISLRYKFILIIAFVEIIFLSLLLIFSLNVIEKQEETLFTNKKEIVNKFITDIFATPILVNDVATIDDAIRNIISKDDIISIEVFDGYDTPLSSLCIDNCQEEFKTSGEYEIKGKYFFVQQEPIKVDNTQIGSIKIVFNTSKSRENINEFFNTMFLIASLEILVVFIVGWYANNLLINSLFKLKRATENFAKTGEYQELTINSKDELEDLSHNFESMQKTIIEHRHTLEDRIAKEVQANREKDLVILKQARTAAMGDLISRLAHQWRQPLNVLSLLFEDIKDAYYAKELDADYLEDSSKEYGKTIQGLSNTIDNFRSFFKPQGEKAEFSVYMKIEEMKEILKLELASKDISLTLECNEGFKRTKFLGFENELKQAFLNIFQNSIEAILKQKEEREFSGRITVKGFIKDSIITIEIDDNGCGIDPSIKDKIFEPYFTTKDADIGKGIGLYMSKTTVEKMDGEISVTNSEDGAKVVLKLPL